MNNETLTKDEARKVLALLENGVTSALATLTNIVNQPINPMDFKTYKEVCEAEEIDPLTSLPFSNPKSLKEVSTNGAFKLQTIFEAFNNRCGEDFNKTFIPDYADDDQYKYYLWHEFDASLGRFVCTGTNYTYTLTCLGARFCTDTRDKATYVATQFNAEWNEFLNPQL